MELLDLMLKRRSVRKYTGEAIPEEKLQEILQAGLASPTGRNKKTWEFVLVRDKEMLQKLSVCRTAGAGILAGADAAIVVLGDTTVTDVWAEDCSITMAYMHLMADALGVGSCWVQGRLREAPGGGTAEAVVKELLGVPENYALEAMLCLGMPEKHPDGYKKEDLLEQKIHLEKF